MVEVGKSGSSRLRLPVCPSSSVKCEVGLCRERGFLGHWKERSFVCGPLIWSSFLHSPLTISPSSLPPMRMSSADNEPESRTTMLVNIPLMKVRGLLGWILPNGGWKSLFAMAGKKEAFQIQRSPVARGLGQGQLWTPPTVRKGGWDVLLPLCRLLPHCQCVSEFSTKYTAKLMYFHNGFGCMISFPQTEEWYQFGVREFANCKDLTWWILF